MTLEPKAGIEGVLCSPFGSGARCFFISSTHLALYTNDDSIECQILQCRIGASPRRAQLYANKIATLTWSTYRRKG
jgi:predicted DNA-binding helix-hairpin-helix protein